MPGVIGDGGGGGEWRGRRCGAYFRGIIFHLVDHSPRASFPGGYGGEGGKTERSASHKLKYLRPRMGCEILIGWR